MYVHEMTWIVTGAGGQLGSVIFRELVRRGESPMGLVSPGGPAPAGAGVVPVDLTDVVAVAAVFEQSAPRYIVHTAAISSVAGALADPGRTRRINVVATGELARLALRIGARFIYTSTDMVFDGESAPYAEAHEPSPLSMYGRSKLEGELAARNDPNALVIRLPLLYGKPAVARETTFVSQVRALTAGAPLSLFTDEYRTPLWLDDAARAILLAAQSDRVGCLHLAGPERLSRLDMGRLLAERLGVSRPDLRPVRRADVPAAEPRARDLSLDDSEYRRAFGAAAGRTMKDALQAADIGV
jgi:dTDP-4-dehydrorhamnose reductase